MRMVGVAPASGRPPKVRTMQIDMTRFRETFFAEAAEHLAAMEADLLRLDGSEQNTEILANIFRCAHSIKGGASTFEFAALTRFTHALETLLDQMRHGAVPVTPALVELLLQANDMLTALLSSASQNQPLPADMEPLLAELGRQCTTAEK